MEDLGLFDFNVDDILKSANESNTIGNDIYRPNIIKENLTTYSAVLKLLPWYKNVGSSIIDKWVVFLNNPNTNEMKSFDCPTTLGKDVPSVFQTAFFALRESQKSSLRDLQKSFKRTKQYFSLVQIIEDDQHPELVGQVKIWQYTQQCYDIIKTLSKPVSKFDKANNPFDIFNGKLFNFNIKLKVESKTLKFPDYTGSKFLDKTHGILIKGEEYDSMDQKAEIVTYLKENSPNLDQFVYKELTSENKSYIENTILDLIPEGPELTKIMKKHPDFFGNKEYTKPVKKQTPKYSEDEDDGQIPFLTDDDEDIPATKPKARPQEKPKAKPTPPPVDEEDEDELLDDDFSDFDLD